MGLKDPITKEYTRNPVIFADAFNKYLYHGKQIIKPEQLREMDTTEIIVPYGGDGAGVPEQRFRDVLKVWMTDGNVAYCLLGIENHSDIHYALPVKNGLYDFMQYADQVKATARVHKAQRKRSDKENLLGKELLSDLDKCEDADENEHVRIVQENNAVVTAKEKAVSSGEFLSGFYKTDRLIPVVTLVIYFGSDVWDGPLTLREMYAETDEEILQYFPDYKINLLAPAHMSEEELEEFQTSLREVMIFNKYANNKDKLLEAVNEDENFLSLDRQAAEVIGVTTNTKLKYEAEEEAVNVCLAIQELEEECEIRGKAKGKIEAYYDMGLSVEEIAERMKLSVEYVQEIIDEME